MRNNVSKEDVKYVALLAHIELSEEEKETLTEQLNEIIEYFRNVDTVDTEGIKPTYHVLELLNIFQEDEVLPSLPANEILKNAARKEKRFFKAPRII